MSTQKILAQLYASVIEILEQSLIDFNIVFEREKEVLMQFADALKLDVTDPQRKDDWEHTAKIALMPVAQKCVISILRELIKLCRRNSGSEIDISAERFQYICDKDKQAFDWETFPQSVGLKEDEAKFAVDHTAEVLLKTSLFQSPVTLTMDGEDYEIYHAGDGFRIRRNDTH